MGAHGATAAMWAAIICDDWGVGYSQPGRWDIRDGGTTDCSALAAFVYNKGGASPPFPPDTWTGNIRAYAANRGFQILDWHPKLALEVGDGLLSEAASGGVGHIAIYTGGGTVREAWIAETGDIDGAPGDQTGGETRTVAYSAHPYTVGGQWTHVLRPTHTAPPGGGQKKEDEMTPDQAKKLDEVHQLLHKHLAPAIGRLDRARAEEVARDAGLRAAVEQVASSQGVDPGKLVQAVQQATAEALRGVELTLTAKEV